MRRFFVLIIVLIFAQNMIAGENEEFRATWVISWEHINSFSTAFQNKANVRKILDDHKMANMNAVLWQCRQGGTAYYNSSYEPWGSYADYKDPGYDPLSYAVQQAHNRGMELHAWFNVFQTSSTHSGSPAAEHPEWVCRDRDGNPMTASRAVSPGLAEVREYTIKVAMEIVRNYDIDGLHLDYVRWNEHTNSPQSINLAKIAEEQQALDGEISNKQIVELNTNLSGRYLYDHQHPYSAGVPGGFSNWEEWWRWSVTEFVRVLHDSIQAVKPWVRLSPAVLGKYNWSGWQGYGIVYQDGALWFNEGYIEQLAPMHYHWTTGSGFYYMLTGSNNGCWEPYIQKGINDGRLFTVGPGSYQFAKNKVWNNHPGVIESCRSIDWVDGFQFFSYDSWDDYQYWDDAGATFFRHKTKIRPISFVSKPEPPSIVVNKVDSLIYKIDVSTPVSLEKSQWFATYRSTDDNYNTENDEIIDVHFGMGNYSLIDIFAGTQDYNGKYRYFATTLNRYWNESNASNVALSDSIPSFPPTVISTNPAEAESININENIIINFSKTMNTSSLNDAISIEPLINFSQQVWSNENKSLTLKPDGYFKFNTSYTLTINPTAKDVNGKAIDGNSDGIGGDVFALNFQTLAVDNVPPRIIYTYPDFKTSTDNFDIQDIITIVFDELIEPTTIDENSISLYINSTKVPNTFTHTVVNEKSVISIQPEEPLLPDTEYSALVWNTITDTSGNSLESYFTVNFKTSKKRYVEIDLIEDFSSPGDWWQPGNSGSTTGIVGLNTIWGYTTSNYLPAVTPAKSAYLQYEWDVSDSTFLIREYLPNNDPKIKTFDSTYTLQCYVFGDGSLNKFRFCIDEQDEGSWSGHEVSSWITIDWYGWKLLEWKLSETNSVGEWIGNAVLDGSSYRFDSFQLTHESNTAIKGKIYFDDLRLVKKSTEIADVQENNPNAAVTFKLHQNYPNPFNSSTKIYFYLPTEEKVSLKIYNTLGREVRSLVNAENKQTGHYQITWDGTDNFGNQVASGMYVYTLKYGDFQVSKRMILLK